MTKTNAAFGGGPYDAQATAARIASGGGETGVVLLVRNGKHGDGFEVQLDGPALVELPRVLREIAHHVEMQLIESGFIGAVEPEPSGK